ncbi:putative reverse transcriptase domain-containing protein [Tanacetum coccineum]
MSQATDVVSTTSRSRDSIVNGRTLKHTHVFHGQISQVLIQMFSGSDVLAEVHNPDNMDNNMINQGVHARPSSKQSSVVNHSETEITSDSNIILYSLYVHETQQPSIQNSNTSAQQDTLILSVI